MRKMTQSAAVIIDPPNLLEELWLLARRKGWNQQETAAQLSKFVGVEIKARSVTAWMSDAKNPNKRNPNKLMMAQLKKFLTAHK